MLKYLITIVVQLSICITNNVYNSVRLDTIEGFALNVLINTLVFMGVYHIVDMFLPDKD